MAIDGVSGANVGQGGTALGSGKVQDLQDQFMKILLTQLRHQDPLEPLKDKDFLAQMAQFSSATQMSEMHKTVKSALEWLMVSQANQNLLSAARLIGSKFKAKVDGKTVEGVIESVCLDSGRIMVKSGDKLVPISSVFHIGAQSVKESEG